MRRFGPSGFLLCQCLSSRMAFLYVSICESSTATRTLARWLSKTLCWKGSKAMLAFESLVGSVILFLSPDKWLNWLWANSEISW